MSKGVATSLSVLRRAMSDVEEQVHSEQARGLAVAAALLVHQVTERWEMSLADGLTIQVPPPSEEDAPLSGLRRRQRPPVLASRR